MPFHFEKRAEKTKLELKLRGPRFDRNRDALKSGFNSRPRAVSAKEKNVKATFVPARALMAKALAGLVAATPA